MGGVEDSRRRLIARLRTLLDVRGKSVAAVERELGWARGYLAEALREEKRLTLDALLRVLDHLGIEPEDFFSGRLPDPWERGDGEVHEPTPGALAGGEQIARSLEHLAALLVTRGVLSADEAERVLRPLRR